MDCPQAGGNFSQYYHDLRLDRLWLRGAIRLAKQGVLALTRSLLWSGQRYNIRCNAIAPGPFPTEGRGAELMPGDLVTKFDPAARIPLKRVGDHQGWPTWLPTCCPIIRDTLPERPSLLMVGGSGMAVNSVTWKRLHPINGTLEKMRK